MKNNPFKHLKKHEWFLLIISLIIVSASNLMTGTPSPLTFSATLIGVTALIFVARGDVFGQFLTVIFSILYGINSLTFRYYGEMITYVFMTLPSAVASIITWLKHPYEKGRNEVKIHRLTFTETALVIVLTILVTHIFYYILRYFNTANLTVSTVSVATSFLACFLLMYRNSYYALAYAANDIVLIILWILASMEDWSYFPMAICFLMFFINDIYGFVSWKRREKKQQNKIFDEYL